MHIFQLPLANLAETEKTISIMCGRATYVSSSAYFLVLAQRRFVFLQNDERNPKIKIHSTIP